MGLLRRQLSALIALLACLATAGSALGASSPITHPERDYAGSELAKRHFGPLQMLRPAGLPGLDVSSWQGNVEWAAVAANGARFAYVKATESTSYVNPYFAQQYVGSYQVGLVRGAYHFALPDRSSGAAQAAFFATNGGAWSADNQTLPGALDIEYNPYGPTCYGLSQSAMVSWIAGFLNEYQARTGRWATIYTTTNWWQQCTGNYGGFGASPLWIARWSDEVGPLPAGWSTYTFWQWTNQPVEFPGDQDVFNGSQEALVALANNGPPPPPHPSTAAGPASTTGTPAPASACGPMPRPTRDRHAAGQSESTDPPGELLTRPRAPRPRPFAARRKGPGAEPARRPAAFARPQGQAGPRPPPLTALRDDHARQTERAAGDG